MKLKIIITFFLSLNLLGSLFGQKDFDETRTNNTQISKVDSLILIIENENLKQEQRRNAIFALGKIKTQKSIIYLIDNIKTYLIKGHTLSDDEQAQEYPFLYILKKEYKNETTLLPFIINELEKKVNQKRMNLYALALSQTCGEKKAKIFLEDYQKNISCEIALKNLIRLTDLLNGKAKF